MASEFATFSDYFVISNGGTPSTAEVVIDLGEGDSAGGVVEFYAPAHLPAVIALGAEEAGVLVLRYPTTRFHEVYQLLRDGARTIVVAPVANIGALITSSSATSTSDAQMRWDARYADSPAD